jgi:glutamate dehydrogenase/leucine dehydrogenase
VVQNLNRHFWTEAEVVSKQECMMVNAFRQVYDTSVKFGSDMRVAAYIVALNRLAEAMKYRGMF